MSKTSTQAATSAEPTLDVKMEEARKTKKKIKTGKAGGSSGEIEVSLHQDSAFSLFFFTLILDTLSECLREGLP